MSELSLILSNEERNKADYRKAIEDTLRVIIDSISDSSAFSGVDPYVLREKIEGVSLLDEYGIGFDNTLKLIQDLIIPNLLRTWSTNYMPHLHSPALIESIASELIIATFNDSMDSWDQGPAATELEVHVINSLCRLYGYGPGSDGAFTSGGSQSNLSAIIAHRDDYINRKLGWNVKRKGLPECFSRLRLYTSEISHFSMEKSCHILGLGYDSVVKLPVDARCKVDIQEFEKIVAQDVKMGLLPFLAVATIGTTDFGSIDDVAAMRRVCDRYGMNLHADAAYGSGLIMSDKYSNRLGQLSLCDSITVDFHKMFLLPISCSAILVKDAKLLECFELHADYLNREEDEDDGYINLVGKGIQTTRRFDALKVFMSFKMRGKEGFGKIIETFVENAQYFYSKIVNDDRFEVALPPEISSVVFRLRESDDVNKRVRRELLKDGIVIGQTVKDNAVMLKFTLLNPNLTHDHIDSLINRIKEIADNLN